MGATFVYVLNHYGVVVAWDDASANVSDTAFHGVIRDVEEDMVIVTDTGFHAKAGNPANMKSCKRGTWNGRMVVETVLSMLTTVCRLKKLTHRTWPALRRRLAFTLAVFNILVQWNGLPTDMNGNVRLSIAEFGL